MPCFRKMPACSPAWGGRNTVVCVAQASLTLRIWPDAAAAAGCEGLADAEAAAFAAAELGATGAETGAAAPPQALSVSSMARAAAANRARDPPIGVRPSG